MSEAMLTQALKTSIEFQVTEAKILMMLKFQRIAKMAYKRWVDTVEKCQTYEEAAFNYEFWTIEKSKEQIHREGLSHWEAYLYCKAKVRKYKNQI